MAKEAYIKIAKHPERGAAMYFEDVETLASETGTDVGEWDSREGWVPLDALREGAMADLIEEALLAGRLRLREVEG